MKHITDEAVLAELNKVLVESFLTASTALQGMSTTARAFVETQLMSAFRNVFRMTLGYGGMLIIAVAVTTNQRLPDKSKGVTAAAEEQENDNHSDTRAETESSDNTDKVEIVESRSSTSKEKTEEIV